MQQELQARFPTLPWLTWAQAFDNLQLPLLVEDGTVTLAYEDLTRLTQSIAREVEAAYPGPPVYCTRALYLARKLDALVGFALLALEELEADPLVCGPLAFEVIIKLAEDNCVALEVLQAMGRLGSTDQQRATMILSDETGAFSMSERLHRLTHLYQAARAAAGK